MNELGASPIRQDIESLRHVGADKFDPVRFFYIEALAQRTTSCQDSVKRILDDRLAQALVTLRKHFEQAQTETQQAVDLVTSQYPQVAAELQLLHEDGDFTAVKQRIAGLASSVHCTPLGELTRHLSHHRPQNADVIIKGGAGIRPELKATQYFRNTWAKLSIDKRVTQALGQAPKNAGPINSHMLVLRSLALMRDISPDYLNRLTSYVDTLLCLDQCDKQKPTTARKTTDPASGKRIKSRSARGQSR